MGDGSFADTVLGRMDGNVTDLVRLTAGMDARLASVEDRQDRMERERNDSRKLKVQTSAAKESVLLAWLKALAIWGTVATVLVGEAVNIFKALNGA